jgi:hypothetical protein
MMLTKINLFNVCPQLTGCPQVFANGFKGQSFPVNCSHATIP